MRTALSGWRPSPPPTRLPRASPRFRRCRTLFFSGGRLRARRLRSSRASPDIPRCASIMAADRIAPKGLAMFFPAIGGAEPCTGSNIGSMPRTQITARGHPQPALQSRREIGDDVAKHVVGDDDIKPARIAHHLHTERVHVHVLRLDLWILRGDFLEHALPQTAGVRHGVRFVAHQHSPPRRTIKLSCCSRSTQTHSG